MQKIMNSMFLVAALAIISCNGKQEGKALADKKAELEKLKKQQTQIDNQVRSLEIEVAKLDPSSVVEKAKLVTITPMATADFTHYIDLQGRIDAVNVSNISPRNGVGGQVKAVYVKKGDLVKKGQLLLQLDDVIAKQSLNAAQQSLAATKAQLDLATDLYKRRKNLWDQGIGTEVDVLTAKTNADNVQNQYKSQQESFKNNEEQVKYTSVLSDVDGVADDVNIRVGENFTGANQIRIVNTSNLKVVAQVPENYLGRVKVGSHIIISLPDIHKTIDAIVTVASSMIDNNSRSFYIEAKIPSAKEFHPNQVAMVQIRDYNTSNAMTVPINTLQTDDKGKFVMVATTEKGKLVAHKKIVQAGEFYADRIEIKSGLQPGDSLITDGYQGLYEGQLLTTDAK
jgi:membrane fusion protein, multidrug efflux system